MTYKEKLQDKIYEIEQAFSQYFDNALPASELINDAMLYSLNAGGKRIRPLLLLELCKAYGGQKEKAMPFAVALEMIHTYSLIHDDLPCMDDDDLRRGKPTSHVVYGYDMAVLAGDGLLNRAYEVMIGEVVKNKGEWALCCAMQTIAESAGASGMILGQVADIKLQADDMSPDTLDYINHYKTGQLLTAAIVAGAQIADAPETEIEKLKSIGQEIGLLFQVVDDLLDIIGNVETLGKRTQMDIQNDKITYPLLLGIDQTQMKIREIQVRLNHKINELMIDADFLVETIQFLVNRDH